MQHFCGPKDRTASFYCDNAPELISSARKLKWRLSTATTGMPQTNGVAENCVRRTKEGGGCGIVQSGLNAATFWPEAGQHSCCSANIAIIDGDSAYNRRRKAGHFKGQSFPFGALVAFFFPRTTPGLNPWELKQSQVCLSVTTFTQVDCGAATTKSLRLHHSAKMALRSSQK